MCAYIRALNKQTSILYLAGIATTISTYAKVRQNFKTLCIAEFKQTPYSSRIMEVTSESVATGVP